MARVWRIRLPRLKKGFLVLLFPLSTAVQQDTAKTASGLTELQKRTRHKVLFTPIVAHLGHSADAEGPKWPCSHIGHCFWSPGCLPSLQSSTQGAKTL